ncbi:hypothetical protein Q5P01_000459 [Channa striata]|uniref:Uncharacterized protein n=1 Tax=Channa striata TaxID=64152 RepID=A0AA88IIU8_CHASR|nr:hypothetical protein Q5P01_000459 [Channa striata]
MFRIDNDYVIDATITGGPARYINHSCAPNCITEVVTVEKENKIIISSCRRIQRGEELCYDYKFDLEDDQHKIPCHCGAVNCHFCDLPPSLSVSTTNFTVSEVCEEMSDVCPDNAERMKQQLVCREALTQPREDFKPELLHESGKPSFRFRCPGPGVFHCTLTGLVFVMTQEAELQYRTVQWDENLFLCAGKMPAGPLFDFQCSAKALCQLHLPHCETDALLSDGLLSVVHITDDGMSFIKLLQITETHVVVEVPHLSAFGVVWNFFGRFWKMTKPISSQVLLFLEQPNLKTKRQNLNVFLLPRNVPLEQVRAQHLDSKYIKAPSKCKLFKDQSYSVHCPAAYKIQPEEEEFDLEFGPNYHPTFEIRLPLNTEEVTIIVRDRKRTRVWKRVVDLTGNDFAETLSVPAEKKLKSVRKQFVDRIPAAVLAALLDKLLELGVIADGEMEEITATAKRAEKARMLIDTVKKKGTDASLALISALCEEDPCLSKELKLK